MSETISTYTELQERIALWDQGFREGHATPLGSANRTKHWYYSLSIDSFGPSKFIGYKDVDLDNYDSNDMNGGITEAAIKGIDEYQDLSEKYPKRKILLVDSLGASLGYGLLVDFAVEMKKGIQV